MLYPLQNGIEDLPAKILEKIPFEGLVPFLDSRIPVYRPPGEHQLWEDLWISRLVAISKGSEP